MAHQTPVLPALPLWSDTVLTQEKRLFEEQPPRNCISRSHESANGSHSRLSSRFHPKQTTNTVYAMSALEL